MRNETSTSRKTSAQYRKRVEDLVGDQSPVTVLQQFTELLKNELADINDFALRKKDEGKWSIIDILQHLIDAEMVQGYRLRIVLTSREPHIIGYDQDLWVNRFNDPNKSLHDALKELEMLRNYNLKVIQSISKEELEKTYIHEERGEETIAYMLKLLAGHDLIHLEQIKRNKNVSQ